MIPVTRIESLSLFVQVMPNQCDLRVQASIRECVNVMDKGSGSPGGRDVKVWSFRSAVKILVDASSTWQKLFDIRQRSLEHLVKIVLNRLGGTFKTFSEAI